MASENVGTKLQEFFRTEGRRLLKEAMTANPGDKLDAQIASASINLDIPFGSLVKVHQGRCGFRMFLKIHAQHRAWRDATKHEATAADVVERLDRVEHSLAELSQILSAIHRTQAQSADRESDRVGAMGSAA